MNREDVANDLAVENNEILRGRLEQAEALLREMRTIFSIPPYWHERIDALLSSQQGEQHSCKNCLGVDPESCLFKHPEQAEGAQGVAINYASLHEYACSVGVDYNNLCAAVRAALAQPSPAPVLVHCACGDAFPVNSYGAGFMDANNGVCQNCDAANSSTKEPELERPEVGDE